MPKGKPPLGKEQVALIGRWVAEGAVWPKGLILKDNRRADASWWSLQPLSKAEPPLPLGIPDDWARHTIDRFIYDELARHHLKPSPEADRRTLIRRLTFDLIGLPPTPEEIDAFLLDRSPDAYEKLVDRLLASPRYGERWGRHWLDVIRFGESNGYERNHLHDNAWPFRDYIIRSFNDDKPYDRLVIEHLAGDQLEPGNPDVEVGTGFIVAGSYDDVGNSDPVAAAQIHANMLDDAVAATSTAFLGLTINCARCHDHKFDPIPQADYYRLQCAFAGMNQGTRPLATAEQRKKFAADRKRFDEGQKNRTEGEEEPRRSIAEPRLPEAWIGHFRQPSEPTYLMKGGDPQNHGETIAPASLSVLEKVVPTYTLPVNAPEGQRRLALARWMVDRANPLTPRVLVNRLWHYHFGRGIVATPSDFGFQGIRPTHPQLLDWLARQLHANDWRMKPLHRLIVTSQTYRQSSRFEASMAASDADSLYHWRFPPRRLEAEAIRDAMLSVAGKLDLTMGGPGFRLFDYRVDNVAIYAPRDRFGPETYRRSVYHQNPRRCGSICSVSSTVPTFRSPRRSATSRFRPFRRCRWRTTPSPSTCRDSWPSGWNTTFPMARRPIASPGVPVGPGSPAGARRNRNVCADDHQARLARLLPGDVQPQRIHLCRLNRSSTVARCWAVSAADWPASPWARCWANSKPRPRRPADRTSPPRPNACWRSSAPAACRTWTPGTTSRRWKNITASRCPARNMPCRSKGPTAT